MPPGPRPASNRLTIRSIHDDPRGAAIREAAAHHGIDLAGPVGVADLVFVAGDLGDDDRRQLGAFLADPLLQTATWDEPTAADDVVAYEITFHPGVTDAAADALRHAAEHLGVKVTAAASGRRIELPAGPGLDPATVDLLLRRVIANPVIERWAPGRIEPVFAPTESTPLRAATVPIRDLDEAGLAALNVERAMALDPAELLAIRAHFTDLGRDPTDVELETLAQTWSEHCAHKTFRAAITLRGADGSSRPITPLLRQLREATDRVAAPFVRSAFVGNAGIVSFADGESLALKAETHNHPSAVEPFGGANTGVGGVIRDVMGAGHRPLAVTDILCFGPADTPDADVPDGALHPRRIIAGVVDGIADYGNKIGLPNVAGAVLYDPAFTTNPLVFAGCIGVADDDPRVAAPPGPHPGDRVVVIGGATGRDGIRGATFSSLAMDATTGEVAGASVQIGDPITEKLLIDVLDEAGDLWTAITDCGAGGLSSAVGEMAAEPTGEHHHVGADVDLLAVPLKYPGLEPWEIWLSEAQERMVLAVAPDDVEALAAVCSRHRVAMADIGEFTGEGRLVVRVGADAVLDLDVGFLHDGRPQRQMTATAFAPARTATGRRVDDPAAALLGLLAHPNIASKADVIHRYDHEIGGNTHVRPLMGDDDRGHGDGVVLARPGHAAQAGRGVAVGIGVNPWHGVHDPEAMAHAAVDEAIRNVVAAGADPDRVALLDNFSWGDPRDEATLGGLVAAVAGCCDAALAYDAPFVSGKDSLNNTYTGRDGLRHAVPPTLVVTAVAHVPDPESCVTPELTAAGNVLVQVGPTGVHFAGSHLDLLTGDHAEPSAEAGSTPQPDPSALARYRVLHRAILDGTVRACHDVSEGGLAVAVAEMCVASGLGARLTALPHDDVTAALFSETAGRLVVEVTAADVEAFVARFSDTGGATVLGTVTGDATLAIDGVLSLPVADLTAAFTGRAEPVPSTIWAQIEADPSRSVPRTADVTIRSQNLAAPTALVVAGPGTNRDPDVAFALELAGFTPRIALVDDLFASTDPLTGAQVVVVAGGFSYGDALGAGRLLGLDLTAAHGGRLGDALRRAVDRGTPVLGICNGFQVLTRTGLLPGALGHNAAGTFDCRWVSLAVEASSTSIWTRHAAPLIDCPIAHGEGRYVHPDPDGLAAAGQVALRYAGVNPNGSVGDIAGVSDPTGLVLGLMPHPENHAVARQHPRHRRRPETAGRLGLSLFESVRRHLA